jgi:hypothetical protein
MRLFSRGRRTLAMVRAYYAGQGHFEKAKVKGESASLRAEDHRENW